MCRLAVFLLGLLDPLSPHKSVFTHQLYQAFPTALAQSPHLKPSASFMTPHVYSWQASGLVTFALPVAFSMPHLPSLLQSETCLFSQAWQLTPMVGTSLCVLPFHLEVHQLSIAPVILPALPQRLPALLRSISFLILGLKLLRHVYLYMCLCPLLTNRNSVS